jgi:GxxExxY protein
MNRRAAEHAEARVPENRVSESVIGAATEVHKTLGPGLLESAHESCLCRELYLRGISLERQKALPVAYKGHLADCGYPLDLLVEGLVMVEVKTVEKLLPIHEAQLLTYLRLCGLRLGLVINLAAPLLTRGVRRVVLRLPDDSSAPSASLR